MASFPIDPETYWRLAVDPRSLLIEEFDDGGVVFNPASWETHLLNPAALLFLNALLNRPSSLVELCKLLTEEDGDEADEGLQGEVLVALESLQKVGLVSAEASAIH